MPEHKREHRFVPRILLAAALIASGGLAFSVPAAAQDTDPVGRRQHLVQLHQHARVMQPLDEGEKHLVVAERRPGASRPWRCPS